MQVYNPGIKCNLARGSTCLALAYVVMGPNPTSARTFVAKVLQMVIIIIISSSSSSSSSSSRSSSSSSSGSSGSSSSGGSSSSSSSSSRSGSSNGSSMVVPRSSVFPPFELLITYAEM
jgi:hypothetical protein